MAKNNNTLHTARAGKMNDFYTRLDTIENEMYNYKDQFEGKVICLPCDESEHTNFFKHFMMNLDVYKWKKLIAIGYRQNRNCEVHTVTVHDGNEVEENKYLIGDGDFRNQDTIDLIAESDIVVTNPPFTFFREIIKLLVDMDKKFILLGNQNSIGHKEVFPLIRANKVWFGYAFNKVFEFEVRGAYNYQRAVIEDGEEKHLTKVPAICWYTNMPVKKREFILNTEYTYEYGLKKGLYKKYDNYDAINIDKTNLIPMDYDGVMGVPITFLDKYNPNQFEIIGLLASAGYNAEQVGIPKTWDNREARGVVDGKVVYSRILIKKK